MLDIKEELKKFYYQTDNCVRCGRCSTVCPTFAVSNKETMLARGRIRLAREYVEKKLEPSRRFKLYNDLCLGCNACVEVCPPRIGVANLLGLIKADIVAEEGQNLLESIMLKKVLNSPQSFRKVIALLGIYAKTGMNNLLPESISSKGRMLPQIPVKSFFEQYRPGNGNNNKKKYRIGYFVGCLTNALFPDVALDAIRVLEHHGCDVFISPEINCCGLPQRAAGDIEESNRLAQKNIEIFLKEKVDFIVTDCGTCGNALKQYSEYFSDNTAVDAKSFSSKVRDINELLVDITGVQAGKSIQKGITVTYHESCHLNRGQKVSRQPRELLKAIPGIRYLEMPEANWCCGAAGSFSIKHQDVASKILERKVNNIKSTGAQYVTAGCPACLMYLDFGRREYGINYTVKHPVQLLAQTLEPD